MAEHWIEAAQALEIAGDPISLCTRLHAGLITARARTFSSAGQEAHGVAVPKKFWWATGRAALEQDWTSGDFSTWIDQRQQLFAFGVTFSLSSVLEMVPSDKRALIARNLSVAGSREWVPAKEARRLADDRFRPDLMTAGSAIVEQARLGFASARAVLAQGSTDGPTARDWDWDWEEREWDVPTWFWTGFTGADRSSQDWDIGRFAGRGQAPDKTRWITLSGVHFLRANIDALDPNSAPDKAPETSKGRPPKYDWPTAISTCWGRINRGELTVSSQSEVEKLLIEILRVGDDEPGESTVRPFARNIWVEVSKP
jgi:hypothetical protein